MNEQGLHSGAAQAALQRAAEDDRRKRYEEAQQRMMDRQGEPITRISINSPHRVQTSGGEAAFNIIIPTEASGNSDGAATPDFPFKGSILDATHVNVFYGQLNNPGGGTFADAGASTGTNQSIAVAGGDDGIYLKVTTDASTYFVTGVEIISAASPSNTATVYHIFLFSIDTTGDVVITEQFETTNLNYLNAAGSHVPWV